MVMRLHLFPLKETVVCDALQFTSENLQQHLANYTQTNRCVYAIFPLNIVIFLSKRALLLSWLQLSEQSNRTDIGWALEQYRHQNSHINLSYLVNVDSHSSLPPSICPRWF